jgi:hypothetical protein
MSKSIGKADKLNRCQRQSVVKWCVATMIGSSSNIPVLPKHQSSPSENCSCWTGLQRMLSAQQPQNTRAGTL